MTNNVAYKNNYIQSKMRFKNKSCHVGHCNRLLQRSEELSLQRPEELCLSLVSSLGLATISRQRAGVIEYAPSKLTEASKCLRRCFPMSSWLNDAATKARDILNNSKRKVRTCYVLCQSHDFCVAHDIAQRTVTIYVPAVNFSRSSK